MSWIRTIGFTLCMTVLVSLLIARSFMAVSVIGLFLVIAVIGLALYFIFGPEEYAQSISIVFISSAIVLIIIGFATNDIQVVLNQGAQRAEAAVQKIENEMQTREGSIEFLQKSADSTWANQVLMSNLASVCQRRNILLELILLFAGLFGTATALSHFKNKQKPDYGIMIRTILSVAIVYLLALIINYIAMSRVIGGTGVLTG